MSSDRLISDVRPTSVLASAVRKNLVATLAVALFASTAAATCPIGFTVPAGVPASAAGASPWSLAAADFNGDGRLDLAFPNNFAGQVSIVLGLGNGSFQAPVSYPVGPNAFGIAAGDLNADGKPDLVVTNASVASICVLLGNGDGTFQGAVFYPVGSTPTSVAIGDLNGDSKVDLIVTNRDSANLSYLRGNGDGTFQAANTTPSGANPQHITIGDLNGDGTPDLVVSMQSTANIAIIQGYGGGAFSQPGFVHLGPAGTSVRQVALHDFDGDGKPDIVAATSNGVSASRNTGNFTFATSSDSTAGSGPYGLAIGDFDGNSVPDVVVANFSGNSLTLRLRTTSPTIPYGPQSDFPVGIQPQAIVTGDFNLDGFLDAATINTSSGTISVLLGTGKGTFPPVSTHIDINPSFLSVADLNGDTRPDLVFGPGPLANSIGVRLADVNGVFQAPVAYAFASSPTSLAIADTNADNKPDLIVSTSTRTYIMMGDGNGAFVAGQDWQGASPRVALADFNHDGKVDLATTGGLRLGNGDGTFAGQSWGFFPQVNPTSLTIADFNADNHPDVAISNGGSQSYSIILGNGDGTFQFATHYPAGSSPNRIIAADFDNNGTADLVIANTFSASGISFHSGNGNGTFQPGVFYSGAGQTHLVVPADFDGDGMLDLAAANFNFDSANIACLRGNGNGTFSTAAIIPIGSRHHSLAAADFNADGLPDIVAVSAGSFEIGALLLLNSGGAPTLTAPAHASACIGSSATFSVTSSGSPATIQWQVADPSVIGGWADLSDGPVSVQAQQIGVASGANTLLLQYSPTAPAAACFRCRVGDACGLSTSGIAVLTVPTGPVITAHPADVRTGNYTPANFSVASGGPGPFSYQWEWRRAGEVSWITVASGANSDGTASFSAANPTSASPTISDYHEGPSFGVRPIVTGQFRCVVSTLCGSSPSSAAGLRVCPADFNGSGSATVQDLFDFLSAWFLHSATSDFNYSGSSTVQDLFDYLSAWFLKCPA